MLRFEMEAEEAAESPKPLLARGRSPRWVLTNLKNPITLTGLMLPRLEGTLCMGGARKCLLAKPRCMRDSSLALLL